jgi:hypothetical protein
VRFESKFGIDVPRWLPQKLTPNMVVTFAVGLRACCVAVGLLLVTSRAAEPVSPLIGATREQLLLRRGEPKSQMEAGNRVVYFYPRERVVLRDNVVIEVEPLAADSAEQPAPTSPTTGNEGETPAGERAAPSTAQAPGATDSRIEIKLVRPPSKDGRPAPSEPVRPEPPSTAPAPEPVAPTSPALAETAPKTETVTVEARPPPSKQTKPAPVAPVPAAEEKAAGELAEKKRKEEDLAAARSRMAEAPAPAPEANWFGVRTYVLAFVVITGGAILLFWRFRQRQLELAASSVEATPVLAPNTPAFTGNAFSADVLSRLEWKRFEELVVAYYNKTGVVAARTRTGPAGPVQIKIAWKGEPRPFAYVQCIAQPPAIIDAKPLQSLVAALAADDIRRGYVVTPGKFNVAAREFAAENHLTLLSGDTLLEKLNALPAGARTEIMQAVSTGDYTIPSCPKCEGKMIASADNPSVWQCPKHPDQTIPVRT